ncbi:DNA-binding transcriptional activator LysR and ABC-type nitrate/sulfonate/bicarbonate transport system,tauA [Halomicronema hongdechloris C2206]|uniref:DNA-binding transcriptional activator LysR and ABC-type nitrate/sulfonate/bicarbonate transport system,tauA n=1 Tax=Halomicronema hongdechloris C2206 TaxID=1641165 RepID=A0A1Z3HKD9_9CYAN|nr:LysR substrate-binding domain-containing protein [Halomicronema hongdechloris]ASC70779.1 DNA-binding transcriptional activator LysR and ABC-type nitrate/sulfonate/bicarbonate transport system,tauA [Halomicronema hongdechloris C2206]
MEIYQLKVFLEVARCLSFTEAATALNLTQPAVSAKIKSLEADLDTPLFNRLGRRIELTQVGQYLLEEAPYLVDLEAQLIAEIEDIKQGKFSTLKIGCMAELNNHWLPSVLFEYRRQWPSVQTRCCQFESAEKLYRAIKNGDADLGFSDLSFSEFDDLSETVIDTIHYSLIASRNHRLAQQPWLSLKELLHQPWVLLPDGSPSRIIFEKRLRELGLSLADFTQVEIVDAPGLVRTYVLQGHYLSFIADVDLQIEQQAGLIQAIALEEFALGTPLFLLMSKRLARALAQQPIPFRGRQALEPIRQFITLLHQRQSPPAPQRQTAATDSTPPPPARFQAPHFIRRPRSSQPGDTLTLTIGTQNRTIQTVTAGLIIQRLGLLEHFLPQQGRYRGTQYQIRWWDYTSGAPIVAGLASKQIDIGVLGDYPLLLSAMPPQGTDANTCLISFVASNPDGTGNDIIVPHRSHLSRIEDLEGRVIAVPFSSAAHSMVMRSLHHKNLLEQVRLTSIDNLNPQRLISDLGQVDGYAYFAPFHEIAKHKGQCRRLLEDNLDGLPTFHGIVVQQELASQYPEVVVAYLQALLAAQYWYATTPMAATLVSRWVNLDAAIVSKTLLTGASDYTQGVFFPETHIRADWVSEHVNQLQHIAGHEYLGQMNLNHWMQPEFLQRAVASL